MPEPLIGDVPDHLLNAFGFRRVDDAECGPTLEMDIGPHVNNPHGSLHGGLMSVLIECGAAGFAVRAGGSENIVATDMNTRFLTVVRTGPARVIGKVLRVGRRAILVQADVIDVGAERRLVSTSTLSYARLDA